MLGIFLGESGKAGKMYINLTIGFQEIPMEWSFGWSSSKEVAAIQ
jgi:hypothetical protein